MYPINDREYLKICAEIASVMSISLASAKKILEIKLTKCSSTTIEEKRKIAKEYLLSCQKDNENGKSSVQIFDQLMDTLEGDDNFLVED